MITLSWNNPNLFTLCPPPSIGTIWGTWGALYDKLDKDPNENAVVNAKTLLENAKGNMIRTPKDKVVVVDGLEDYIIVDKEDVLFDLSKG